jgi:hypothetical protein
MRPSYVCTSNEAPFSSLLLIDPLSNCSQFPPLLPRLHLALFVDGFSPFRGAELVSEFI